MLEYSVNRLEPIDPLFKEGFRYKIVHLPTKVLKGVFKTNEQASEVCDSLNGIYEEKPVEDNLEDLSEPTSDAPAIQTFSSLDVSCTQERDSELGDEPTG